LREIEVQPVCLHRDFFHLTQQIKLLWKALALVVCISAAVVLVVIDVEVVFVAVVLSSKLGKFAVVDVTEVNIAGLCVLNWTCISTPAIFRKPPSTNSVKAPVNTAQC
jgi:hypothetical protein